MATQLTAFVEAIRDSGLLPPEQVEQIAGWAAQADAEPAVVAKEIVKRGWLTPFQVKLFWKGRGAELIYNQYVITERLGEGGMGQVFRARHRRMEREVALKVIRRERLANPDVVRRFTREVQASARLVHENIVMAYDADQIGDRHFFAMEYVEGENLARLVKEKGPLCVERACDCIRQAALGLQHAFECGMVHRDIKPSNLLLGKNGVLKILDLGLARILDTGEGNCESRITREGLVVGTPDYLAPEQARNSRSADIRADIYSLGCTFYYLLAGHGPYQGGTPTEKVLKHSTEPIPALPRDDVPPPIAALINRMLAKTPEERYQQPGEVAALLQQFATSLPANQSGHPVRLDEGEPAQPPVDLPAKTGSRHAFALPSDPGEAAPAEMPRGNWLLLMGVFVCLFLLAASAYLLWRS